MSATSSPGSTLERDVLERADASALEALPHVLDDDRGAAHFTTIGQRAFAVAYPFAVTVAWSTSGCPTEAGGNAPGPVRDDRLLPDAVLDDVHADLADDRQPGEEHLEVDLRGDRLAGGVRDRTE